MEADHAGLWLPRESTTPPAVFGSETHGFRIYRPLLEDAVREFETRHGVSLPEGYWGFLIHVGNGGAAPAYGLFKLGVMDGGFGYKPWTENGGFVGVLSQPFPHTGPWNDLAEEPVYDESRTDDSAWEDEYQR